MQSCVPERCAGRCIECHEVCRRVSGKEQVSGRAQKTGACRGTAVPWMRPPDLAGLVIDRLQHSFRPASTIVAAPPLWLLVILVLIEVVHAEGAHGVCVEEACGRAETRVRPVRA